jgi:hypothetical protein
LKIAINCYKDAGDETPQPSTQDINMILETLYALVIVFIVIPSILINFVMGLTLYKVREILNELRQEAVVAAAKVIRGETICAR